MRRRSLRVLRWVALVWLGYALIGTAVLNTALGPQLINRKPEAFRLDWRHALTLWPGHAVMWNVTARGHVRRVVWQVDAARASGRIALLSLLGKELRMPDITAHEVRAVLERVDDDRRPPDARPGGWTLRFDSIASDSIRSLRVDTVRLQGEGTGRLALSKQLRGGPLAIARSTLRMQAADVSDADVQWLVDASIDATLALAPHTREQASGWARLKLTTAHLAIDGQTPGVRVGLDAKRRWSVDVSPPGTASPVTGRGTSAAVGRVAVDIGIANGQLQPGGTLALVAPLAASSADGQPWQGESRVDLRVGEADVGLIVHLPPPPGDHGRIDARLTLAGRELPLEGDTPALLARVSGAVGLRWHFDSLHWFAPLFARAPWLTLDGAGEIDADITIAAGELADGSTLTVPAIDLTVDVLDNRIAGSAKATGRIDGAGADRRTRLALTLDRFEMSPVDAPGDIHVRGRDLELDLSAAGHLAHVRDSLTAHLRFARAEVPDLTVYNRYLPGKGVRFLAGNGRLDGDLNIDARGEVGSGRLDVRASGARLAIGDLDVAGDLALVARLRRADLAMRRFDLDGSTLDITRLREVDRSRGADTDWWARATLDRGHVVWGRPMDVDAQVSARARNAGLLLSLFAHRKEYPRWVFGLVDAGEARIVTRLRMDGTALVMDPLHAANERFDVRARLRLADPQPLGDLLIAWGRLSVGLAIARGERDWHLRKAAEWFAGRSLPR